jgi:hypothetical protein
MQGLRLVAVLVTLAVPLAPRAASRVELGIGADYLTGPESGEFQLTLAGDRALSHYVSAGLRSGVLFTSDPSHVGVPIDFRLRFHGSRLYVDGLVGPWFVFSSGDTVRFHGAIGVGLRTRSVSVGVEAGVLHDTGIVGIRVAFEI